MLLLDIPGLYSSGWAAPLGPVKWTEPLIL